MTQYFVIQGINSYDLVEEASNTSWLGKLWTPLYQRCISWMSWPLIQLGGTCLAWYIALRVGALSQDKPSRDVPWPSHIHDPFDRQFNMTVWKIPYYIEGLISFTALIWVGNQRRRKGSYLLFPYCPEPGFFSASWNFRTAQFQDSSNVLTTYKSLYSTLPLTRR